MNGSALFVGHWLESGPSGWALSGPGPPTGGIMIGGMAAFLTAVGTSLISCLMVGRRRNRRGLLFC